MSGATKKKFANSNLNSVLGAPKETAKPANAGPAVRSAALKKVEAKPKGLISLGKAPLCSGGQVRKGAAFSQLEKKAKEQKEETDAKKDVLASPDWAVIDFNDLDKPLSKGKDEEQGEERTADDGSPQMETEISGDAPGQDAFGEPAVTKPCHDASSSATGAEQPATEECSTPHAEPAESPPPCPTAPACVAKGAPVPPSEPPPAPAPPPPAAVSWVDEGAPGQPMRKKSWADAQEEEEEEEAHVRFIPPQSQCPEVPFTSARSKGPPPGPPPRRPPPAGPPPAQPQPIMTILSSARPMPAGPPPPMPPPAPMPAEPWAASSAPAVGVHMAPPAAAEGADAMAGLVPEPPAQIDADTVGPAGLGIPPEPQKQPPDQPPPQEPPPQSQAPVRLREPRHQQPPREQPPPPQHQPAQRPHYYSQQQGETSVRHSKTGLANTAKGSGKDSKSTESGKEPARGKGPTSKGAGKASKGEDSAALSQHGGQAAWGPTPRPPAHMPSSQQASSSGEQRQQQPPPTAAPPPPRHGPPGPVGTGSSHHPRSSGGDHSRHDLRGEPRNAGGSGSPSSHPHGNAEQQRSCWGPAVAYTPAFAPRVQMADRPMNEDFVNSGWKEKKLWQPPVDEVRPTRSPAAGNHNAPRSRLRAEENAGKAAASDKGSGGVGAGGAGTSAEPATANADAAAGPAPARPASGDTHEQKGGTEEKHNMSSLHEGGDAGGGAEAPKPRKSPKVPRRPLEALDPDSSSEESEDEAWPAEFAVLDLTVPRTALVINVSHVLKRLNGCCSLNQLTKSVKAFKEKFGVTLEAFLRANPTTFKIEGRIVYLVDSDGEKWKPPPGSQPANVNANTRRQGVQPARSGGAVAQHNGGGGGGGGGGGKGSQGGHDAGKKWNRASKAGNSADSGYYGNSGQSGRRGHGKDADGSYWDASDWSTSGWSYNDSSWSASSTWWSNGRK